MKTAKLIVILIVSVFIGASSLLLSIKYEPERKSDRRLIAEEEVKIEWLYYQLAANQVLYAAIPAVISAIGLVLSGAFGLAFVRKQSVVRARIGEHSDIPVHYRDLRSFYPIAVNLSLAEIEASVSNSQEKAFQISEGILKSIALCTRSLKSNSDLPSQPALTPGLPELSQGIPTFKDLLSQGVFTPGKPLIFGMTQEGQAKTGSWSDLFSSAIAGQSGQGKTSTLRSLIAQSLLTGQVGQFWILDYHYPHPESLLASLGSVKDCHYIKYAQSRLDTLHLVSEIEANLDARLDGLEPSQPVKVVVMDETLILADRMPEIKNLIFRIGTEGRKAGMYGLFSAQTWKAQDVGGSDVRDNLTSIIAHKMKQRQAQTLLQDRESVKACKRLHTGQALFVPTKGEPEILNIPLCTPDDMQEVFERLSKNVNQDAPRVSGAIEVESVCKDVSVSHDMPESTQSHTAQVTGNTQESQPLSDSELLQVFREKKEQGLSVSELARALEFDRTYLSKWLSGTEPMTDTLRPKLQTYL